MSEAETAELVYESVEDARTGEIIPIEPEPPRAKLNTLATNLDLTKVGTLILDEKAEAILAEPLDPEDVRIRPDGLVYLPWTWYASRLNRALGRLAWGLIPQAGAQSKDIGNHMILVLWGHWLAVRGVIVGFEYGEMTYRTDNNKMSFGDAAAGAKSNSLARNCKMLGMSLELWDADWVNQWRKKYAETYEERGKTFWRRRTKKSDQSAQPVQSTQPTQTTQPVPPAEDAVKAAVQTDEGKENGNGETRYSIEGLRKMEVVSRIAELSGKKKSEVAIEIGKFEKGSKHSISEVVALLKGNEGGENAAQ